MFNNEERPWDFLLHMRKALGRVVLHGMVVEHIVLHIMVVGHIVLYRRKAVRHNVLHRIKAVGHIVLQ